MFNICHYVFHVILWNLFRPYPRYLSVKHSTPTEVIRYKK